MFRRHDEMQMNILDRCHGGEGKLQCFSVMQAVDSTQGILFMHDDIIEPGASIGEHLHESEEEIYFVVEGHGTMILDGKQMPMGPGDVSLVVPGHTHGLINSDESPMRLIVVCVRKQ